MLGAGRADDVKCRSTTLLDDRVPQDVACGEAVPGAPHLNGGAATNILHATATHYILVAAGLHSDCGACPAVDETVADLVTGTVCSEEDAVPIA